MTGLDIVRVRPVIESEIDRLIAILDMLEPDPDLEDGADHEPWLGAPAGVQLNGYGTNWQGLNTLGNDDREDDGDDREEVSEDEGAQCDDEGAIDCDLEPDNDDEEDNWMLPVHSDFYSPPITTKPGLAVQS